MPWKDTYYNRFNQFEQETYFELIPLTHIFVYIYIYMIYTHMYHNDKYPTYSQVYYSRHILITLNVIIIIHPRYHFEAFSPPAPLNISSASLQKRLNILQKLVEKSQRLSTFEGALRSHEAPLNLDEAHQLETSGHISNFLENQIPIFNGHVSKYTGISRSNCWIPTLKETFFLPPGNLR